MLKMIIWVTDSKKLAEVLRNLNVEDPYFSRKLAWKPEWGIEPIYYPWEWVERIKFPVWVIKDGILTLYASDLSVRLWEEDNEVFKFIKELIRLDVPMRINNGTE